MPQPDNKNKIVPVIVLKGKVFSGKDHGEAIEKAQKAGHDISGVDRERDGKFMVGTDVYTRKEALKEFGISHSHEIGQPKVLIISDEWLAPSLALKIKNEGCNVFVALKRPTNILKGTIRRIPYEERLEYAKMCDLVIYEDKSNNNESSELRASGVSVIGGDKLTDKLELDRLWGNKLASLSGLKVPEMIPIDSFEQVRDIIRERGGKWVLKQCGKIDEIKGLSFVAKMDNSEDLLDFLPILEKEWVDSVKKDFVLQEKVEGHEFAVGGYWNGHEFMKDEDGDEIIEQNWEHKALFPGNLGESTGEQYTVMQYMKAKDSKLFMETLDKCRELLKGIDFRGDFDINTIVNEKGAYFLEFTPRMGVPATSAQLEIQKSSWYEFLKACADGTQPKAYSYDPRMCIVSWLYTKPFPAVFSDDGVNENPSGLEEIKKTISTRMSNSEGIKLNFKKDFTKEDWSHIHPDGIRFKDDRLEVANTDGYVLTATAMDDTVEGAGAKLEELFKKIVLPKAFWRNDFDKSNYHKSKKDLTKWGYLPKDKKMAQLDKEQTRKEVREMLKKVVK